MADADFDGLGGGFPRGSPAAQGGVPSRGVVARRLVTVAGAAASLALVVGFGLWGYRLAVRDVQGVPVIQALDGPMRIAPEDPGGEVADNQGLAVNNVAAVGAAAPLPDELILAPRPIALTDEDTAGLAGMDPSAPALAAAPVAALPGDADLALAAAPLTESASPTEVAVDAALAEALGLTPDAVSADAVDDAAEALESGSEVGPELVPELGPEFAAEPMLEPAPGLASAELAPAGAIITSPRPKARPDTRASVLAGDSATDAPAGGAIGAVSSGEIDPATIPVGTRLVQFGAFDTADQARAEWVRLSGQFGELLAKKGMVLQPAESGGRTFYRLRAHGFEDEDDARRFCSAFVAQDATCIPVPQR